jgi:hypothetical protein
MNQKDRSLNSILTAVATLILMTGGYGFYRQLSLQSLNKENSIRSKLVWLERLKDGRTALCNRDDKTALNKLKLKTSTGDWLVVSIDQPLAPSRCTDSIRLPIPESIEVTHFSALWEGELEVRFEEVLPLLK